MNPLAKHDWLIRLAKPEELNFIYSTWLNNYRHDSSLGKSCRNSVFFAEYPSVLDHILHRPLTKVLVTYFEESPDLILAYLVYEPGILHYLFTKEIYRSHSIATSLFMKAFEEDLKKSSPIQLTHRTASVEAILKKYNSILNFNPFLLYQKFESKGENQ